MSLVERVSDELKDSMRARDAGRTTALRGIRAAFLHEMKKDGSDDLPAETCVAVLRRLAKQRKESIAAFEGAGREDRAATERAELAIVETFLPQLADEATTRAWVEAAVAATGAAAAGDLGRVMGSLMKEHKGEVDGALARRLAQEILS